MISKKTEWGIESQLRLRKQPSTMNIWSSCHIPSLRTVKWLKWTNSKKRIALFSRAVWGGGLDFNYEDSQGLAKHYEQVKLCGDQAPEKI